jgi:hypothetical protein
LMSTCYSVFKDTQDKPSGNLASEVVGWFK